MTDKVTELADELAKRDGYLSIWSPPREKRQKFMDKAKLIIAAFAQPIPDKRGEE